MSRKLLLEDAHGQREFLLVGTLTVGRDPRCEISANDPLLSRQHAEFVETASGVLVRDLHSQNGIRVNDIAVKEAALRTGDIVQIARMTLRFLEEVSAQPGVAAPASASDDDKTQILKAPAAGRPESAAAAAPATPPPLAPTPPAGGASLPITPVPPPVSPPHAGASSKSGPGAADDGGDGDRTRVVPMPAVAARAPRPAASAPATPSSASSAPAAPAAEPAAAARSAASRAASASAAAGAAGAASPASAAAIVDRVIADDAPAKPPVRTPRGTWGGRVLLRILMLGLLCSLVSAVPLMFWHQQQVSAVAQSRATTLSNWFAAEASLALERSQDAGPAVEALSREAGVVSARILSPEGHVIAPASRAAEVISSIPGIDVAPADVLRQRSGWNGDLLEVVQPVSTSRGPRTALAWLTINPTTEFGGSSLVIVAPAVVAAIFIAWIIAMLITRPTLRALGQLNEDVELALSGRLDGVTDPLGAKPVKELTDTINYLAARLRTTGLDVGLEPGRRGPFMVGGNTGQRPALAAGGVSTGAASAAGGAASQAQPHAGDRGGGSGGSSVGSGSSRGSTSPSASSTGSGSGAAANAASGARQGSAGAGQQTAAASPDSANTGQLIVDTAFRVIEADPACAALLGTRVDALIGHHLLDAITDRLIVDAVLGCLSALPASGEREASATDASGRTIAVAVGRTGKEQPVTVTLRVTEAPHA